MTTEEMEKALHATAHKIGELCERFDTIEETMEYHTKLLEGILEAIPQPGKKPNLMEAMKPIMNHPLFKSNPAMAEMLNTFTKNMGGSE